MTGTQESIPPLRTTDKVFRTLRGWILSGRFKPGESLPSQEDLARQLQVSRDTLREAIFRLSALGLVNSRQGVGTIVEPTTPSGYIDSLPQSMLLDPVTVAEFIEARLFTERTIICLATARADQEDLQRLRSIVQRQKTAIDQGRPHLFNDHDLNFHAELGRIGGNGVMLKFLQSIWALLSKFTGNSYRVPGNIELAYEQHCRIVDAITGRDAAKAQALLVDHVMQIAEKTVRHLDLNLDPSHLLDHIFKWQPASLNRSLRGGCMPANFE